MAFSFTWNATFNATPADTESITLGASRIRDTKAAIQERMNVDHSWNGDSLDGTHTKVTLPAQGADPGTVAATGYSYTKAVSGNTELFYKDSTGVVLQITSGGKIAATALTGAPTFSGNVTAPAFVTSLNASVFGSTASIGTYIQIRTGSSVDFEILNPSLISILNVPTGTNNFVAAGSITASGGFVGNLTGTASQANTATNQSGGTVSATTITASGNVTFSGTTNAIHGTTTIDTLQTLSVAFNVETWSAGALTVSSASHTIIITGGSGNITLPSAASNGGRELHLVLKTTGISIQSVTSNVVPLTGGAAGTAILSATTGKYATLQSDGTNWQIIAAN